MLIYKARIVETQMLDTVVSNYATVKLWVIVLSFFIL